MINDFEPEHFVKNLFRTAKAVLLSPRGFYEGMKTEGGLRNPLMFLVCCVIVHAAIVGVLYKSQSLIARNLVLGTVMPFVTAGILFFFIKGFFKASGTYERAFRVNAYAGAVSLLSWFPVAGFVLEFYRIYLLVVGLSCAFSIKTSRSFLAVLMTLFVYMLLSGAIYHITGGQWPPASQ